MPARVGCARFGGFVVQEELRDIGLDAVAWRCVICGDVTDRVILNNRLGRGPLEWIAEEPVWGDDLMTTVPKRDSEECGP